MIIEQNTNYAYKLKYMDNPSFDKVRDLSKRFFLDLPQSVQGELFETLNRGVDLLDSEPQMSTYLHAFGMMHQAKLQYAFGKLPDEFLSQTEIEILDYGCGQALGTMCYADFLRTNGYSQKVKSITLIEPSEICLKRAALHASVFFPDAEIKTVNKTFDDLLEDDIVCREETPTLHILSNVLDMTCFNLDTFSGLIKDCLKGYNQFVCVGPYFKNDQRDDQIQEFASYFCDDVFYELKEKKELNPEKDWTCAVCLFFVGLKYKIIEERKFPAEVIANIKSVEVIEDDSGNLQACFYFHNGDITYKQLSETCKAVKGDRIKVESLKAMELSNGAHHIVRIDGEVMNPLSSIPAKHLYYLSNLTMNVVSDLITQLQKDEDFQYRFLGDEIKVKLVGLSRQEIVDTVGIERLLNVVRENYFNTNGYNGTEEEQGESNMAEAVNIDLWDNLDIIYNNWDAFITLGYKRLLKNEKIVLTDAVESDVEFDGIDEEFSEEIDSEASEDGELQAWQIGHQHVSAESRISDKMRRMCSALPIINANGKYVLDEFGYNWYTFEDEQKCMAKLLEWLSPCETLSEMKEVLKVKSSANKWVYRIIGTPDMETGEYTGGLLEDEKFANEFFTSFKNQDKNLNT